MVQVQYLNNGIWVTASTIVNDPQFYLVEMRNVQTSFPSCRVRVIDENGLLLDFMF